jgi:hypothetical protein
VTLIPMAISGVWELREDTRVLLHLFGALHLYRA